MCAEQIPLEAKVCEYCGTKFEVIVKEGKATSRVLEEPSVPPSPPAQPVSPPMPAPKHITQWVWIAGGLGVLLILALVGGGIMMAQTGLPFLSTPTNTPRPTATPNYATTQQARDQQATTIAQNAWVQDFAQPILDEIAKHRPNFEDDFSVMSGRFVHWNDSTEGVTFGEGVMHLDTTGASWVAASGSISSTDFVLKYEFLPNTIGSNSAICSNFRSDDSGGYNFCVNLSDEWWGMGNFPPSGDYYAILEGGESGVSTSHTTRITIIAKDDEFAFYVNDRFVGYKQDNSHHGSWVDIGVYAPNGPAEVDFDNVKFWDLNNLKP